MNMSVARSSRITLVVTVIGLLTAVPDGPALAQTTVTLTFRGPMQEPVAISSAQLLITAWGVSEHRDLHVEGQVVRLDVDATRPPFADSIADTRGFVYVKAAGFAPVMSEAFAWPRPGGHAVLDFRNGRRVTIPHGERTSLDVPLRRPVPRRVRLVDLDGRAVPEAKVEAAAYWPTPSHCGFMRGRDVLASGSTNQDGAFDVPDVDGPHLFSLLERDLLFADAENFYPAGFEGQGLIASLHSAETTLRVRRYARQRLAVHVVREGKPVAGAVLWADLGLGTCGAGAGPLAKADAEGRIRTEPLYPERWKHYWICTGDRQAWDLPAGAGLPATIDLSSLGPPRTVSADRCGK